LTANVIRSMPLRRAAPIAVIVSLLTGLFLAMPGPAHADSRPFAGDAGTWSRVYNLTGYWLAADRNRIQAEESSPDAFADITQGPDDTFAGQTSTWTANANRSGDSFFVYVRWRVMDSSGKFTGWYLAQRVSNPGPIGNSSSSCGFTDFDGYSINGRVPLACSSWVANPSDSGNSAWHNLESSVFLEDKTATTHTMAASQSQGLLDQYCQHQISWLNCGYTVNSRTTVAGPLRTASNMYTNCSQNGEYVALAYSLTGAESTNFPASVAVTSQLRAVARSSLNATWPSTATATGSGFNYFGSGTTLQGQAQQAFDTVNGTVSYTVGNDTWTFTNAAFSEPTTTLSVRSVLHGTVDRTHCNDQYGQTVLTSNPRIFWRMDDSNVTDSGTLHQPGKLNGALNRDIRFLYQGVTNPLTGNVNDQSATLYGSGSIVSPVAYKPGDTYTTELWFRTNTRSGGELVGFGNNQTVASSTYDRNIYLTDDGRLTGGVWNNGAQTVTSNKSYTDGQWHQVVETLSPAGLKLYIDGGKETITNETVNTGQDYTGYLKVGGDNLTAWPNQPTTTKFTGDIDDVAWYPTALTSTQVAANYAAAGRY
jgi:hypothetical protein